MTKLTSFAAIAAALQDNKTGKSSPNTPKPCQKNNRGVVPSEKVKKQAQNKTVVAVNKTETDKNKRNEGVFDLAEESITLDNADALLFLETVSAAPLGKKRPSQGMHTVLQEKKATSPSVQKEQLGVKDNPAPPPLPQEENLFAKAMAEVMPLTARGRDIAKKVEPNESAKKVYQTAFDSFLEGNYEFAVAHTDEYYEGFVVGSDPVLINKLRAGQYSPEAHIDLHGKNSEQALNSLVWFIKNAYHRNMRTLLVITGRGKNSPDGVGVLRLQLQEWLTKDPFKRVVLAFCTAQPSDGGSGAMYVLLRKFKKNSGKIIWEKNPHSDETGF